MVPSSEKRLNDHKAPPTRDSYNPKLYGYDDQRKFFHFSHWHLKSLHSCHTRKNIPVIVLLFFSIHRKNSTLAEWIAGHSSATPQMLYPL